VVYMTETFEQAVNQIRVL